MNQPRQQPEEVPSAAAASATSKKRFIREFPCARHVERANPCDPPGSCATRPAIGQSQEKRRQCRRAASSVVLSTTGTAQLKKSIPRANPAQASLAAKTT